MGGILGRVATDLILIRVSREPRPLLSQKKLIPTWKFANLHVENEKSPRGDEMKLRKNQMKLPKFFFLPTWRIKNSHVENVKFPRSYCIRLSLVACLDLLQHSINRNEPTERIS